MPGERSATISAKDMETTGQSPSPPFTQNVRRKGVKKAMNPPKAKRRCHQELWRCPEILHHHLCQEGDIRDPGPLEVAPWHRLTIPNRRMQTQRTQSCATFTLVSITFKWLLDNE